MDELACCSADVETLRSRRIDKALRKQQRDVQKTVGDRHEKFA